MESEITESVFFTDLDELVPAGGDNDRVLGVGAETDARSPLGVALLGDGVLAVTESVPELDGSVARTGDDLAVVGREADGKDVVGVADESSSGGTAGELPETQSLVPRGRQSVGTVRGDNLVPTISRVLNYICPPKCYRVRRGTGRTYTVGDDVRVAVEGSLGVAVLGLIASEVPDDQGLVSGGRQEHVGAGEMLVEWPRSKSVTKFVLDVLLHGGSQTGDPAILQIVSLQSFFLLGYLIPRCQLQPS